MTIGHCPEYSLLCHSLKYLLILPPDRLLNVCLNGFLTKVQNISLFEFLAAMNIRLFCMTHATCFHFCLKNYGSRVPYPDIYGIKCAERPSRVNRSSSGFISSFSDFKTYPQRVWLKIHLTGLSTKKALFRSGFYPEVFGRGSL